MGEMIRYSANGGTTDAYQARPAEGRGNDRGVVVIQEWWGLVDHIKKVADRFASEGFSALAPDLYHGKVTRSPDEAGKLLMAMSIAEAEKDLRGAVDHLRATATPGKPVGIVGFCMGGALSLFGACLGGDKVGACVVYYGGHPKVQFDFDRLKAPVLGHWAEKDDWANANIPGLEKAFKARNHRYEFHHYPGTTHAFFNDSRPEVYHRDAAETSWQRTVAF